MKIINSSEFDWPSYFERGKASLKKDLEENPEMFRDWTSSKGRYKLITYLSIILDDINILSGKVTGYFDFNVSSNSIEDLKKLWKSDFIQGRYETTRQHFIADMQEKKIVEFLSVCM